MKLLFLFILLVVSHTFSNAQSVGIGTTTPNPSAVLHVDAGTSLTKGLLVSGTFDANAISPNLSAGSRLIFYPGKAAFRAGTVDDNQWDNMNTGLNSVAFGRNTVASGYASTAFGVNSVSSGDLSIAIGQNSTASGSNSVALGTVAKATGTISTAFGNYTIASGNYSTAMGELSIASGNYSTAMGSESNASGPLSLATGYLTMAGGYASTAMGYSSVATGMYSSASGFNTVAKSFGGVAVGLLNNQDDNPNGESPEPADRIFQVGNGMNGARSNAITILRNGNTGIGALEPAYRLDLAGRMRIRSGGAATSSAGIWLNKNDNSGLLGFVGANGTSDIGVYSTASDWSFLVNTTNGNAWVKGVVTANGVTLTSDERFKKDIVPLGDAMPILEKLNGYQYHWKDETWDASLQTGLLAQEVEKVMPELVKTDDKGMKSVNYMGLIPYFLEATKEQQTIILSLQKQLNDLKQLVEQLAKE